jgi:hypothetical protein
MVFNRDILSNCLLFQFIQYSQKRPFHRPKHVLRLSSTVHIFRRPVIISLLDVDPYT